MTKIEIFEKPGFRQDYGDIESLQNSIEELGGLIHPIVISKDGVIVAGRRRFLAWKNLHKKNPKKFNSNPPYIRLQQTFKEIETTLYNTIQVHENVKRKNFNIDEIANIKRQIETERKSNPGNITGVKGKDTRDFVADMFDLSGKTVDKIVDIADASQKNEKNKKILQRVNRGTLSIESAHKLVTKEKRNLPEIPLPKGTPDVIVCDIPIGFKDEGTRGAASHHYTTYPPEEFIEKFPTLPSADNAIIFFWITPSIQYYEIPIKVEYAKGSQLKIETMTPVYKAVLDKWKFKVVAEFVWDKEIIGNGHYNRNQHENLLVAIKGKFPVPLEAFSSIIKQRREKGTHSKKPSIEEMVEKMYPGRNYMEAFARGDKPQRKNWIYHGNEVIIATVKENGKVKTKKVAPGTPLKVTVDEKETKIEPVKEISPIERIRRLKKK